MILDADELIKEIDSMPDDEFERLFKEALVCSGKYSECMLAHDSPCSYCPNCGAEMENSNG